jgi:hypothetical protein
MPILPIYLVFSKYEQINEYAKGGVCSTSVPEEKFFKILSETLQEGHIRNKV